MRARYSLRTLMILVAVVGVLVGSFVVGAGQVFPRPVWALRWRLWFYQLCVRVQPWIKLVPRRPEFSLLSETPVPIPLATVELKEEIEAAA